jgi:heme exporter protein C
MLQALTGFIHRMGSPPHFHHLAGVLAPWFGWPALLLLIGGTVGGLVFAPADYQQGDGFRIIYVHVPNAWLSLMTYSAMAVCAALALIWRVKIGHALVAVMAPLGATFTALALLTGSLWGKPMWGTWWVWDARLTSELILLFLYLGVIALKGAFSDRDQGDRAAALLAVVGVVNVPIIHYSVIWWNTLHQTATVTKLSAPSISTEMLIPLLMMTLGFSLFLGWAVLRLTRAELVARESGANWVREQLSSITEEGP